MLPPVHTLGCGIVVVARAPTSILERNVFLVFTAAVGHTLLGSVTVALWPHREDTLSMIGIAAHIAPFLERFHLG